MRTVTLDELRDVLATSNDTTLLEALPARYYREGHLPGAIHFPHDEARVRAATVLRAIDARIIVYCASATCQNSHLAARELVALGYTDVAVFVGGKKEWTAAGLTLETGESNAR